MKPVEWLGDSRRAVREFPDAARQQAGVDLFAVQLGDSPSDWKPMSTVGPGANEIRIHAGNEYRVIYIAKFAEAVYVLHAFEKKTRQTSKHDVELATRRYRELTSRRRGT